MSDTRATRNTPYLIFDGPYTWETSDRDIVYRYTKTRSIEDTVKAYGNYFDAAHVKDLLLELCRGNNNGEPVNRIPSIYSLMRLLIELDKLPLDEDNLNKFVNRLARYVESYKEKLDVVEPDIDLEL